MNPKVWYASKTLWWNLLALVVFAAGYFVDTPLRDHPDWTPIFAAIVALGNGALRIFATDRPVSLSSPPSQPPTG